MEPQPAADAAGYLALFPRINTSGWQVQAVAASVQHGAASDGSGGWINPAAPLLPTYKEVRKLEFATFAAAAVGGNATLGGIIKACRDSADNAVIGAYELFKSQATLTKDEMTAILTLLQAKSIVTAQQKSDILAAWPTV